MQYRSRRNNLIDPIAAIPYYENDAVDRVKWEELNKSAFFKCVGPARTWKLSE